MQKSYNCTFIPVRNAWGTPFPVLLSLLPEVREIMFLSLLGFAFRCCVSHLLRTYKCNAEWHDPEVYLRGRLACCVLALEKSLISVSEVFNFFYSNTRRHSRCTVTVRPRAASSYAGCSARPRVSQLRTQV